MSGGRCDQELGDVGEDRFSFGHSSGADRSAGEPAFLGIDEGKARLAQRGQVSLDDRVIPHPGIHGRCEQGRAVAAQHERADQVVGDAARELPDQVCGGGCDHKQVGGFRQPDVLLIRVSGNFPEGGEDGTCRKSLECEGADEADGAFGHGDRDAASALHEARHERANLERRNAAAHADNHLIPGKIPRRRGALARFVRRRGGRAVSAGRGHWCGSRPPAGASRAPRRFCSRGSPAR